MKTDNILTTIGIMSGTSMDGIDFSLIKTDGKNYTKIIFEKNYIYSNNYKRNLKKLIKYLPKNKKNQYIYCKKNENLVTKKFLTYIKKFISLKKIKNYKIDLIGLSGQTIIHNPKKKYSIQLGSGKEIYNKIKIPVVSEFRKNDLINGGQGAPIGSFYHKYILKSINKNAAIINIGGISNITYYKKNKLISFDMGPGNAIIDDLCYYFYKKNYDKNGLLASKGVEIINLLEKYKKNNFFNKCYPKSLDRNEFNNFF